MLAILVTHLNCFKDRPGLEWTHNVLSAFPLEAVLGVFTYILHRVEVSGDRLDASVAILRHLVRSETLRLIQEEVARIQSRRRRPVIFSRIHVLNFIKEAILWCERPTGKVEQRELDLLVRAYLATHDHFPPGRAEGEGRVELVKEDFIRQSLLGLTDHVTYTVPRYWAYWVTLPKRMGRQAELESYLPSSYPRPISTRFLPMLSLWTFWATRNIEEGQSAVLRETHWEVYAGRLNDIRRALADTALDHEKCRQELNWEKASLKKDERWEYSFLTLSKWPIVRIEQNLFCTSLALLLNAFTDGLYHMMLGECKGQRDRVIDMTALFGEIFHEYVDDLWRRVLATDRVAKITQPGEGRKTCDGAVSIPPHLILYEAKSHRFVLQTHRTGKIEDLLLDLSRGMLPGMEQLDSTVKDLKAGTLQVSTLPQGFERLLPVLVTARPFPELPFVYQLIDEMKFQDRLLQEQDIGQIVVLDVQALEILEQVQKSRSDAERLLRLKMLEPSARASSVQDIVLSDLGEIPHNERMRGALLGMIDALHGWLIHGTTDESALDHLVLP